MDREQALSYFFAFLPGAAKVCAFSMFVVLASARPCHAESLQKEREMKVCAVWASALRGQKKSWERGGVCDKTFAAFKSVVREDGQSVFRKKIRTRRCGADVKLSVRLAARAVPLWADRLPPAFSCVRLLRLRVCGACPSRTIRRAAWLPF